MRSNTAQHICCSHQGNDLPPSPARGNIIVTPEIWAVITLDWSWSTWWTLACSFCLIALILISHSRFSSVRMSGCLYWLRCVICCSLSWDFEQILWGSLPPTPTQEQIWVQTKHPQTDSHHKVTKSCWGGLGTWIPHSHAADVLWPWHFLSSQQYTSSPMTFSPMTNERVEPSCCTSQR